ncbi:MAG: hypothetical protein HOJ22_06315 [Chloroflexi bacterium]|nr:hypothetical protein [Chloroflexota bacterium]MBT5627887.1 hypothetical protein [Chloroflexota bacterium]
MSSPAHPLFTSQNLAVHIKICDAEQKIQPRTAIGYDISINVLLIYSFTGVQCAIELDLKAAS